MPELIPGEKTQYDALEGEIDEFLAYLDEINIDSEKSAVKNVEKIFAMYEVRVQLFRKRRDELLLAVQDMQQQLDQRAEVYRQSFETLKHQNNMLKAFIRKLPPHVKQDAIRAAKAGLSIEEEIERGR